MIKPMIHLWRGRWGLRRGRRKRE